MVIVTGPFVGIILPLPAVVLLIITHRLHFFIFDGCVLTHIKKRLGLMPEHLDFLQYALKEITGKNITITASRNIDYSIATLTIFFAIYFQNSISFEVVTALLASFMSLY